MCTVTILPASLLSAANAGVEDPMRWRLACNRDELIARPAALPPSITRVGSRLAIMPVDPESGGTWIGVNDAGLACSLLNVCTGAGAAAPLRPISRGTIIPPLLRYGDIDSALMWASQLQPTRYQPFRLLLVDGKELVECCSDGRTLDRRRQQLHHPVIRTSSGLGDHLVARPRAALFRKFLAATSNKIAAEDLFHLHQWRGREELSVRMRRSDARTVSHTVIEVRERTVSVAYRPAEAADTVSITVAA
jgi:uncharacterized protein with NRDE domain